MPRARRNKNGDQVGCDCAAWEVLAIQDVLMRSPGIRFKEILFRLNEEMGISIGEKTLRAYMVMPRDERSDLRHRCLSWHMVRLLTKATGNPLLLDEQERHAGREVPCQSEHPTDSFNLLCATTIGQACTVIEKISRAMVAGDITPTQMVDLRPHIRDLRRKVDTLDAAASLLISGRTA